MIFSRIRVIFCPYLQYLLIRIEITVVIILYIYTILYKVTKFYLYYFISHIETNDFRVIPHGLKAFLFSYLMYWLSGEYITEAIFILSKIGL